MCVKYFDFQRLAVEFYHKKTTKGKLQFALTSSLL